MPTARKQTRIPVVERRETIINAAFDCLKKGGLEGASVRSISATAGISIGLINHHFTSKEELLAEVYRSVATTLIASAWQAAASAGDDPRVRLSQFFRGSFSLDDHDPGSLKVWMAFWTLTSQSPQVQAVHDETYADYRAHIETLLTRLSDDTGSPRFDVRLAAIGLSAMVDGLWLETCLNPDTFSADEAVRLCETWVDGLVGGAYRHLIR